MNHSHVTQSIAHLDAVASHREHLRELYDTTKRGGLHDSTRSNVGAQIAECHQAIGHGLKAAEIEASIAQAIALERIAARVNELVAATGERA